LSNKGARQQSKRTEADVVIQNPMTFKLGGVEHKVKLLPMKRSAAWRAEFSKSFGGIAGFTEVNIDNPTEVVSALETMVVKVPEKMFDLFFLYAEDLNREEIEEVAYDYEIAAAFKEIARVAFSPLLGSLVEAVEMLK